MLDIVLVSSYKTLQMLDHYSPLYIPVSQSLTDFFQALIIGIEVPQLFYGPFQDVMRILGYPLNIFSKIPLKWYMLLGLL